MTLIKTLGFSVFALMPVIMGGLLWHRTYTANATITDLNDRVLMLQEHRNSAIEKMAGSCRALYNNHPAMMNHCRDQTRSWWGEWYPGFRGPPKP